jgi:hypothetical protein
MSLAALQIMSGEPWEDLSWERRLRSLDGTVPEARVMFEKLIAEAQKRGMRPWIISAARNCQEGSSLSKIPAINSWHTYGRAIDLQLMNPKTGSTQDLETYREMGEWWMAEGGQWGGSWTPDDPVKTFREKDHFQYTPGSTGKVNPSVYEGAASCDDARTRYYQAAWQTDSPFSLPSSSGGVGVGGVLLAFGAALGAVFAFRKSGRLHGSERKKERS